MRLLDRYVLGEWLKAFGLAMAAMLGVLLVAHMYGNISDLISYGAHAREVLHYYWLLFPGMLPAVVPLSQLVSLLFVFSNLHRNNEIVAMRANGMSLWRIAQPVWIAGALLALALGLLNAVVVPWSVEQSRDYRDAMKQAADARRLPATDIGVVAQLTFDNPAQHRRWFIDRYSEFSGNALGVQIYEYDDEGRDVRRLIASTGHYDPAQGCWVLQNVTEFRFDTTTTEPVFKKTYSDKTCPDLTEKPAQMLTQMRQADDLSLNELRGALDQAGATDNRAMDAYAVRYYEILAKPFICLIVVGLAVPFAVAGVRVSPMVGVSKAVGLFFGNYLVSGICTHLGDQHALPAIVAAWLPIACMLGLAWWFFRRAA